MYKGYIDIGKSENGDNDCLLLKVETSYCSEPEQGVYLKLTNNKILIYENSGVSCERITPAKYLLKSTLPLTPELKEMLSKYSIEYLGLAGRIVALSHEAAKKLMVNIKNLPTPPC